MVGTGQFNREACKGAEGDERSMACQLELDFGEENAVEILDGLLPSAIDRIYNMMTDSGARPLVVSRLIAGEIASTIRAMMHGGKGWRRVPYRDLMNRVKGCRELQRNLLGCEKSSVGDHLDMDGPQFSFVFERIVELFRTSLMTPVLMMTLREV